MTLTQTNDDMTMCTATMNNPPIRFATLDYGITHDFGIDDAVVVPVADVPDAVVLEERRVVCSLTAAARSDAFLRYNGSIFRHDPRVRLLENSLGVHGDVSSP